MLVKVDNSTAADPEAASVPLPFPGASPQSTSARCHNLRLTLPPLPSHPGFRYPEFPTPLGTGRNSGATSASLTRPHTPAKNVQFLTMAVAGPGPSSANMKKARSSTGGSLGSNGPALNGVGGGGVDPGAEPGSWAGWALGAWSHTPPRMSEAVGEEDDLVESVDETSIESPASADGRGQVAPAVVVVDDGGTFKAAQREGSVGQAALLRLVGDPPA